MIQSLNPLISGEWRMTYSLGGELVTNESWYLINDPSIITDGALSDEGEQGIVHIWSSPMVSTW